MSNSAYSNRPTGWIIASVVLGGATLALLVWVANVESQSATQETGVASQLGQLNGQVNDLSTAVSRQQVQATSTAGAVSQQRATATVLLGTASQQLSSAQADFETVKEGLGVTTEAVTTTQSQVAQLKQRADDARAQAKAAASDLAAAATASQARADVSQACIRAIIGIMDGVYSADDPRAVLPTAASQLKQLEPACAAPQ